MRVGLDPGSRSLPKAAVDRVHPHVYVDAESVRRAKQKEQAEEVPLEIDVRVGAEPDIGEPRSVTRQGIERPDDDHDHREPPQQRTEVVIHTIDGVRQAKPDGVVRQGHPPVVGSWPCI